MKNRLLTVLAAVLLLGGLGGCGPVGDAVCVVTFTGDQVCVARQLDRQLTNEAGSPEQVAQYDALVVELHTLLYYRVEDGVSRSVIAQAYADAMEVLP